MSNDIDDDAANGGPSSHRYLYRIDRKALFALFVAAAASLTVTAEGCRCLSVEAQALSRMARAVQERADSRLPRESALAGLATVTRVLLSRTDSRDHDREDDEYWHGPMAELVAHFLRLRAELGDMLPASGTWRSPVAVPDDLSAMSAATVVRDDDGRLWGELDPEDEVSEGPALVTEEGGYTWQDGQPPQPLDR